MKPINFIEPLLPVKKKHNLLLQIAVALCALTGLCTAAYVHVQAQEEVENFHKKNIKIQHHAAKVTELEQALLRTQAEKDDAANTLKSLEKKHTKKTTLFDLLIALEQKLPSSMSLESLITDQQQSRLTGQAPQGDHLLIQEFISDCMKEPWCSDASIELLPTNNNLITFNIHLTHPSTGNIHGHY